MQHPGPSRDFQSTLSAFTASVAREDWIAAREWIAELETVAHRQMSISSKRNKLKWAELLSAAALALIAVRAKDADGCAEVILQLKGLVIA
jgi:hypothetical protein